MFSCPSTKIVGHERSCPKNVMLQVLEDLLALIRRVVEEQREELLLDG